MKRSVIYQAVLITELLILENCVMKQESYKKENSFSHIAIAVFPSVVTTSEKRKK